MTSRLSVSRASNDSPDGCSPAGASDDDEEEEEEDDDEEEEEPAGMRSRFPSALESTGHRARSGFGWSAFRIGTVGSSAKLASGVGAGSTRMDGSGSSGPSCSADDRRGVSHLRRQEAPRTV